MTDSPIILVAGDPRAEEWAVVLHRYGRIVPHTPRYFPVATSYDEAIERIDIRRRIDPEWARRWSGWNATAMRVDGQITL